MFDELSIRSIACGALLTLICAGLTAQAEDWPSFRGPNRQGQSGETGLLKKWPAAGPKVLWSVTGLGQGYSQPVIADGRVFISGKHGKQGTLFAYSTAGKLLWKYLYGPEVEGDGYPGSRGAAAVDGKRLYLMSGYGRLVCLETASGKRVWQKELRQDFGGTLPRWGFAETVLIDGERLFCAPGGKRAIVALNKHTGEKLWGCAGIDLQASYASAVLMPRKGRKLLVTVLNGAIVGVDSATGKLLWKHPHRTRYGVSANSPLISGDLLYITSAFIGSTCLRLSADGAKITVVWKTKQLDTTHGGVTLVAGRVYGASYNFPKKQWVCLDLATGKLLWQAPGVGQGSSIFADGMLYCYGEKGQLALIRPNLKSWDVVSSFSVTRGSGQHWAHPAISDKRLYIRHGDVMLCHDIRGGAKKK